MAQQKTAKRSQMATFKIYTGDNDKQKMHQKARDFIKVETCDIRNYKMNYLSSYEDLNECCRTDLEIAALWGLD